MTKIRDKSAELHLAARIPVAYNKNCHFSLMTSCVKQAPGNCLAVGLNIIASFGIGPIFVFFSVHQLLKAD